ncbi:MAG: zinc ribbon domain-containing protein [Phycisphaerae bacterium]|nr:zinc ribbon domain-containing protein [Phycisphaerae bacterium]
MINDDSGIIEPDEEDMDDFSGLLQLRDFVEVCPACKEQITRDMDSCPFCGDILFRHLDHGTFAPRKGPIVKIVMMTIIVLLVLMAVVGLLAPWLFG